MSEPQLDDPIALTGEDDPCEDCGLEYDDCACGEPDVMYDEYYGD